MPAGGSALAPLVWCGRGELISGQLTPVKLKRVEVCYKPHLQGSTVAESKVSVSCTSYSKDRNKLHMVDFEALATYEGNNEQNRGKLTPLRPHKKCQELRGSGRRTQQANNSAR